MLEEKSNLVSPNGVMSGVISRVSHKTLFFSQQKSHNEKSLASSFPAGRGLMPLKHMQKDLQKCEIICDMGHSYAIPSIHSVKVKASVKYLNPKVILPAVPKNKVRESLIGRSHGPQSMYKTNGNPLTSCWDIVVWTNIVDSPRDISISVTRMSILTQFA